MRFHQIVPSRGAEQLCLARELQPLLQSIDPTSEIYETVDHAEHTPDDVYVVHAGFGALTPMAQHVVVLRNEFAPVPTLTGDHWAKRPETVVTYRPVVDIAALVALEDHGPTANHFSNNVTGPLVISLDGIGEVQRTSLQVQAYYTLVSHLRDDVHGTFVGDVGDVEDARYLDCLEFEVNELNLNQAWVAGKLGNAERATYLRRSSVAMSARADHVDFAGVITAMAFGVPAVVTDAPGAKELFGSAALILPSDAGAMLIAEALQEVLSNQTLRDELTTQGLRLASGYDVDAARAELFARVLEAIPT